MASSASDSPSSDRNLCNLPSCEDRANYQQHTYFHDLAPALHVVITSYLELADVPHVGTGARWCQESYKPQFTTKLFLLAPPALNHTSTSVITTEADLTFWLAKHAEGLGRLLQKLPRLRYLVIRDDACLREIIAHTLSLLPQIPRLASISEVGLGGRRYRWTPALIAHRPDGLVVAMARGGLRYLQT